MTPAAPSATTSPRGDRRREALLAALDDRLRTTALDDISVADLTVSAGITRSAFYFYFDSKAAAVSVLLVLVHEQARESTTSIISGEGDFRTRVDAALNLLVERVLERDHIYRALLTARTTHQATRELWDRGRAVLAGPIADFIRSERAAGRAPDGADVGTLAQSLVHINESVLERLVYDPDAPRQPLLTTAADMWTRAVYGRLDPAVDAPAVDAPADAAPADAAPAGSPHTTQRITR